VGIDISNFSKPQDDDDVTGPVLPSSVENVSSSAAKVQMAAAGGADRARSAAQAEIAYENSSAGVLFENWSDPTLAAWANGGFVGQVSAGKLYALNFGYMGRPFVVGPDGSARAIFVVNYVYVTGDNTKKVAVGFSTDAAGTTPTSGNTDLSVASIQSNTLRILGNGVATLTQSYTFVITATIDTNGILSIGVRSTDGTLEFSGQGPAQPPVAIVPHQVAIFIQDSRGLAGHSVNPLGARPAIATMVPRAGLEDIQPTVQRTTLGVTGPNPNGNGVIVGLPANYDPRQPRPLAIMYHGRGQFETQVESDANLNTVWNALLTAGYIVAATAYGANTQTWGAQVALDAYTAAYQYVRDNYAIGPVVLVANSMGGLESLLTLAERRIPGIAAWAGYSPAGSLLAADTTEGFSADINTAYNIPGGGTYAAQTAGHDPALMAGYAFRGVPMIFAAATDDTTVPKALNSDVIAALVAPYSPQVVEIAGITGGHGFPFTTVNAQIIAFLQNYAPTPPPVTTLAPAAGVKVSTSQSASGQIPVADGSGGYSWATMAGVRPISGRWYAAAGPTADNQVLTAGRIGCEQFVLAKRTTFQAIGTYIQTVGAAGSLLRLGVYNDAGGCPGSVALDAGTVSGTAGTGLASIATTFTLAPGIYWLAVYVQGGVTSPQCPGYIGNLIMPGVPVDPSVGLLKQGVGLTASGQPATGALPVLGAASWGGASVPPLVVALQAA
jgi:pimeloyl-ACP methyl ester carboxylesterase